MSLITMKFGGTSMGSADAVRQVARIIQDQAAQDNRVLTVVSAMSGTTDSLLKAARSAADGVDDVHANLIAAIRDRHTQAACGLLPAGPARDALLAEIETLLGELSALCHSISVLREVTPRGLDVVSSYGERLAARLLAAHLAARGAPACAIDATGLIVTDANFQDAAPLWEPTRACIAERLKPLLAAGQLPVVTGFIGATPNGIVTTLGRGGSDYSAAILGAGADTDELWIWTDVDGVMTTDPRLAPNARVIPVLSYGEVGELAYFGAKVLHPKTVQPILDRGLPLRVRNTFNPSHPGTLIQPTAQVTPGAVKAVTLIQDVNLITVAGRGMIGVPGIAGRTFMAVARAGASLLMISQSSSEQSFCFILPSHKAQAAATAIRQELANEIARRDVDRVEIQEDVVIITGVGAGMRGMPGVAARLFSALAERDINILAIAQGSSEYSISMVVAAADAEAAVQRLHALVSNGS